MAKKRWNTVHEYFLFDPASNTSKCLVKGCPSILKGKHTSNLLHHFMAHHPKIYSEIRKKNEKIKEKLMLSNNLASPANPAPKTGKTTISNFNVVKKACIDLVKFYEYPISLFDCQAFKEILNVINMKPNERLRLSSKYIEKDLTMDTQCDESMENEKDANNEIEKDNDLEEVEEIDVSKIEVMPSEKRKIKAESIQCTCNVDDETNKHSPDCAVASAQEYFNNSEENTFEAADDVPDSSASSREDMEEVYLDGDFIRGITKTPPEPPKKRRKPEIPTDPIRASDKCDNRQEIEIKVSEETGQSLDRFGLYIASLLKFLPRNKRNNFQSQIVQRLIQEQSSFAA